MSNIQLMRLNRHNSVESSEMYHSMAANQQMMQMPYERPHSYKRKNDFGDGSSYRNDKIMRTNYNMVHVPKEYDMNQDKQRRFSPGSSESMQKVFDRHLGSEDGKCYMLYAYRSFDMGTLSMSF